MSLMSIFAKTLPKIGPLEFDAKLEGSTDKAVYLTQFPVEFGANGNDHAILLPNRYLLTGAVSNTPLGLDLSDIGMMGVGEAATAVGGIGGAAISAVSAYLLSGSDETRASTAWASLTAILEARARFDLDTGKEIMRDMMLVRLTERTRPENEDGLVFIAELQQVRIVRSKVGQGVTSADQLMKNDTVTTQGAPMINAGDTSVEVIQ
ncbi:phage baseplate protein [Pseudomonas sp. IT-P218]|uniref:phage baseplate protein n=1 Tax=Pseudomonas sp. IT-P218 TaxID=3026449 RepID=UPI0039E167A0